jgi:hypothetical protein
MKIKKIVVFYSLGRCKKTNKTDNNKPNKFRVKH